MATNNELKDENPNKNMQISWVIFVILVGITIVLYVFNMSLEKTVETLRTSFN